MKHAFQDNGILYVGEKHIKSEKKINDMWIVNHWHMFNI